MADDNGYPSGMAGGRVVEANPAHEARCLIEVKLDARGRNPFQLTLPAGAEKFVYAYLYPRDSSNQPLLISNQVVPVQTNVVTGTGIRGNWTLRAYALRINDESTQATSTAEAFQTSGRYPDLLDPAEFFPLGQDAAMDIGGMRRAWFEIGPASLDLVVAAAAQSFSGWLQQYGLSGADAAMTAAPAGDGIPNLLKYAFNLDPTRNEGSGLYPGEHRGLPHFAVSAGSHLEMFYYRDTAKPDVDLTPVGAHVWKRRPTGLMCLIFR